LVLQVAVKNQVQKVRQELLAGMSIVKASGKKTSSWTWIDFCGGGTFTMGKVQDDVMHDWNNTPTQQHVQLLYG
jgi:hypothetical protein